MKKIAIASLNQLFAQIAASQTLYIPTDDAAGRAAYTVWQEGSALSNQINTIRSAKDVFFPQVEQLVKFRREGKKISFVEEQTQTAPFAVFGVRACDCRSFEILDRVFLSEPVDTFYAERRNAGTIITLACGKMEETCFCTAFDIDPAEPAGDVSCWMDGENLYWRANTEKGQRLTDGISCLEDAAENSADELQAAIREKAKKLPLGNLNLQGFEKDRLMEVFNSDKWAELSESCLGCGSCTFVCPTCQCYDVQEFDNGKDICRFRCWDSCMYSDFTMMAHGTNRPTQLERFRQRFMHKLVYFPANNEGIFGCVGCGRCLRKCPINMNIVKVAKALKEGKS